MTGRAHLTGPVASATSIVGLDVVDEHAETVGQVVDLVVDFTDGSIVSAVVAYGGVLGFRSRIVLVPWESLEARPEQRCLRMHVHLNRLKAAPGADPSHVPDFDDNEFRRRLHDAGR